MSQNICNICGANYEYRSGRWKCPACGAYKAEELSNEEFTLLSNAAQKLRVQEFGVAEELYADIINKYPEQHEAYWGYVCAKYGIKYEVDFDGRKIPTCCYTTIESFIDDADYKKAVKYAPSEVATWYKLQADYIERVRTTWIEKAKNEAPYDIFISYKDSDIENGIERTEDSYNALELYNHLARQGYTVFYSKESLRDKVGEKYEPYIYHALQTAKVMIVYSSSVDYVNSTWVKNEWHRYIKQISRGEKKEGSLLVVCDGFSPNELPTILSSKQCLDGKSKNLYIDIDEYLKRLYSPKSTEEKAPTPKKKVVVNPLHEHAYTDEVVPASCVARGYTVHRCACGYEYKDNYTNLAEHKYAHKATKEATCTAPGYTEEVCTVCGDKKVTNIPANGHTFGKWIEKTPPTCTVAGKKIRQCSECGYVEEETLAPKGHQWSPIEKRVDEFGNKEYVSFCKLCGEEKVSKETEEERKVRENKEQLSKKSLTSAICSGITAIAFFIFMIINFAGGEKIGWGIIFLLIAIVCGWSSVAFVKEYSKNKPPLTEEERVGRKKKLTLVLVTSVIIIISTIIIVVVSARNDPKSQFKYDQSIFNDYITIEGIKNEDYAIKNGTVEIPSKIDGKSVGLGSFVFKGYNVTTLVLPKDLQEIFSDSLEGCIGLKNIEFKGTISDWEKVDGHEDVDVTKYNFTHLGECQFAEWSIPNNYTCETGGMSTRSCKYCKNTESKTVTATQHTEIKIDGVAATCETAGLTEGKKCSVCGKITQAQTTIKKLGHTEIIDKAVTSTCTKTGLTQGSHCSVCKKTIVEQTITAKAAHNYVGGYCSACSTRKPSEGLSFAAEGDGYSVTYIGTCRDSIIVIPDEYNGKPVISIGQNAFKGCNATEIIIPNSVTTIYKSAFAYCTSIAEFTIPDGVTTLGEYVFQGCSNLQSLNVGKNVKTVGSFCFYDCHKLTKVNIKDVGAWCSIEFGYVVGNPLHYDQHVADRQTQLYLNGQLVTHLIIPGTVTIIQHEVFEGCDNIEKVTISEGVQEIKSEAFMGCSNIRVLNIPKSITKLNYRCFAYLNLTEINFAGTRDQWNNLLKSTDALQSSSIGVVHCSDGDIAY